MIQQGDAALAPLVRFCLGADAPLDSEPRIRKPAHAQSTHGLVGRSADASRIGAWRKKLSARQIEIFEAMAGDLLSELGYTLDYTGHARPPTIRERLQMRAFRRIRYKRNIKHFNRRLTGQH